jgi:hypothetical protein
MHVWWDKLKLCIPSERDSLLVDRTCLVVEDLKIYQKSSCCQSRHDGVIGSNAVVIALGLKSLLKYEVAISMEGNHHILVTGPSSHWGATSVVGEKPAAIITCWLLDQARTGKRPVSSVKSLLRGTTVTTTRLDATMASGGETDGSSGTAAGVLGLVDRTF